MSGGPVLLVMSDLGDERCGVGSSEAALVPLVTNEVRALDPMRGSLWAFRRAVAQAARGAEGAVLAYPTIGQQERVPLVPRVLWLRWVLRRRWVRVHLHEFDRLRRRHRLPVALLVGAVADRIVVSSEREASALRSSYRGWAARAEIVVAPPANGSAPAPRPRRSAPRTGVVGLVGQHRPDKGLSWLLETLDRLDPRFDRLEVVGRGWDEVSWPATVAARVSPTLHGELPDDDMAEIIEGWDLALAPYDEPPHDGRLSLRTPLAYGVPTLTRGPRPAHLQLRAPHLLFDDEVDVGRLPAPSEGRDELAAGIATLEDGIRARLVHELFEP
jgi:glycosyltransferase involved in cell wall biosynthesis